VTIRVFDENGRLYAQMTGGPIVRLLSEGENTFAGADNPAMRLTFGAESPHAATITYRQGQMVMRGNRIQ